MAEPNEEKTGPSAKIDVEGLKRFIRARKLGDPAQLRTENISFGHSNEVHLVSFEDKLWVLRRPPRGPLLPTAHDVIREYRVLAALQDTPVPVPRVYASCDDASFCDRAWHQRHIGEGQARKAARERLDSANDRRGLHSGHRSVTCAHPPSRRQERPGCSGVHAGRGASGRFGDPQGARDDADRP